jgi:hypothetical protein
VARKTAAVPVKIRNPKFLEHIGPMFAIKVILLLVIGAAGLWLSVKQLRKNILEIRSKPQGSHRLEDKVFNYPLMFLWFGYLIVFFGGLIVNNLVFK